MKYAGIIKNDVVNSCYDIAVSVWCQGCPYHCEGCHNPQTWDFDGGIETDRRRLINKIIKAIGENGVQRNLSVLGGEPLCKENITFTCELIHVVKQVYPDIRCFIWTGMTYDEVCGNIKIVEDILPYIDVLIEGRYDKSKRDLSLPFRGSSNQRVIDVQATLKAGKIILYTE